MDTRQLSARSDVFAKAVLERLPEFVVSSDLVRDDIEAGEYYTSLLDIILDDRYSQYVPIDIATDLSEIVSEYPHGFYRQVGEKALKSIAIFCNHLK